MATPNGSSEPQHPAAPTTRSRWQALERNRLWVMAPLAGIFLFGVFSDGLSQGLIDLATIGIPIALLYWLWAYRSGRKFREGAVWSAVVALDLTAFRASSVLAHAAPPQFRGDLVFSDGFVHGRLALTSDEVCWEPIKGSRWGGARPWRLPLNQVVSAETGEIPGYLGGPGLRKIYEALTLNLADGSSIPMYVTGQRDLHDALVRLDIPGAGQPAVPGRSPRP